MIAKTGFRMRGRVPRCLPSSGVDNFSEHFPCSGCEKKILLFFEWKCHLCIFFVKGQTQRASLRLVPSGPLVFCKFIRMCNASELVPGRTLGPEDASQTTHHPSLEGVVTEGTKISKCTISASGHEGHDVRPDTPRGALSLVRSKNKLFPDLINKHTQYTKLGRRAQHRYNNNKSIYLLKNQVALFQHYSSTVHFNRLFSNRLEFSNYLFSSRSFPLDLELHQCRHCVQQNTTRGLALEERALARVLTAFPRIIVRMWEIKGQELHKYNIRSTQSPRAVMDPEGSNCTQCLSQSEQLSLIC